MRRKQLSVSLPLDKIHRLRDLLETKGAERERIRSPHELFRMELEGAAIIAYRTGSLVFHEDLAEIVSSVVEEGGVRVGLDEVGKGESKGPIVVGAVALDGEGRKRAVYAGLVETKSAQLARIIELARTVREAAISIEAVVMAPEEFRKKWRRGNLNVLLAELHEKALRGTVSRLCRADRVIVDSFDYRRLFERLKPLADHLGAELSLEHKADEKHLEVAAASVVARAERQRLMEEGMCGPKWEISSE